MMDTKAAQIIAEVYVINLDGSSLFFLIFSENYIIIIIIIT